MCAAVGSSIAYLNSSEIWAALESKGAVRTVGLLRSMEWLAGLLERGAGYAVKGLGHLQNAVGRLSLWIWVISVLIGSLFFGVGAGATVAENIGIGLAASVVI